MSDGTEAGTVLVEDISPGPDASDPRFMIHYQTGLLFAATSAVGGLWKSDGTLGGTDIVVGDFSPAPPYR